jgi:hypothetical protein
MTGDRVLMIGPAVALAATTLRHIPLAGPIICERGVRRYDRPIGPERLVSRCRRAAPGSREAERRRRQAERKVRP